MGDRDKEMVEFARPAAENGDREMQGRMGRAYRDGRGVDRDLETAMEWMRKASAQRLAWATNELFDMLWDAGESDRFEEMIDAIAPLAEAGNGSAMRRLSHAYRDGKGVEQDLVQARAWLERAAEKNNKLAQKELRQMDEASRLHRCISFYKVSIINQHGRQGMPAGGHMGMLRLQGHLLDEPGQRVQHRLLCRRTFICASVLRA